MKIFVVGSLNMDLVINAPYMPAGGVTISGSGFLSNPGGKGANQATAASKLGGEVYMVGCVGDAFGSELTRTLQGYGIHTDYIEQHREVSSGIAVIVVIDGDNRIILDAGANAKLNKALIDRALAQAERGDYLIVQLETDLQCTAYALSRAKEKGLVTVMNPAPARQLDDAVYRCSDYFMPNQCEAEFYTGIYPSDESSARKCAEALKNRGVKNVLITLGERGACFVGGGAYYASESCKVKAVDTTAAGDTFVGAFVTRMSEGADVSEAMRFACRAAAVTVTRRGAQQAIPYRNEVDG